MPDAPLADRVLARDPRAVARAISLIENESPDAVALVARIHPRTGRAYFVGVTGPPGAGKSTLVDRLIAEARKGGATVGVLAVDPTSPFSGGAVLGDRVRMQAHAEDEGVFIRSMATRGHLGGLARTTSEAAAVLDAAGYDLIIIETVGVGQDEVDIVRTADVSVVIVVPGSGDDVQALKAGIMEIGDVFVVNKADRDGADRTVASIETMLSLDERPAGAWRPPVVRTVATTGTGVAELMEAIQRFRRDAGDRLGARRRARVEWRLREILTRSFLQHLEQDVLEPGELDGILDRVASRATDPYTASGQVLARAIRTSGADVLDHVGIAVADASELVSLFQTLFQLHTGPPEDVGRHRVRFVETGDATLELVEPLQPDSPVAKFLEKRGTGLHHVCLRVKDIDAAMAALRNSGARFIDETPRQGAHGSRIAFIHPSSVGGLLVELKELRHAPRDI
jgi:LAO/AO transport system kinase